METELYRFQMDAEDALLIYAKHGDIKDKNRLCQSIAQHALGSGRPHWLIDAVASYDSVFIQFDCLNVDHHAVIDWVRGCEVSRCDNSEVAALHLPVCYSLDKENDIAVISHHTGMSEEEVISLHSQTRYSVFAIGFASGFAYLGFVPPQLATPRRSAPRTYVPRGAVAIADQQTAIYPSPSPGGWNIVGYCPLQLVNLHNMPISPFAVGQSVSFTPINSHTYMEFEGKHWQQWQQRHDAVD